jgi:hypothetical protein
LDDVLGENFNIVQVYDLIWRRGIEFAGKLVITEGNMGILVDA